LKAKYDEHSTPEEVTQQLVGNQLETTAEECQADVSKEVAASDPTAHEHVEQKAMNNEHRAPEDIAEITGGEQPATSLKEEVQGSQGFEFKDVLPEGWQQVWSKSRSRFYFHHAETNQVTWELPTSTPAHDGGTQITAAASCMSKAAEDRGAQGGAAASTSGKSEEEFQSLPWPWKPVWSKSKLRYYFQNVETNETVWERPAPRLAEDSVSEDSVTNMIDKLV